MRRTLALIAVFGAGMLSARPSAASPSNPAFLGISMKNGVAGPCLVDSVVPGGPAEAARLRADDYVLALDGVMVNGCDTLTTLIVAHEPGEQVRLDVQRHDQQVVTYAMLSTRASVVHRQLVGQAIDGIAIDYDDEHEVELRDVAGQTTILAWADLARCSGCAPLIRRVVDVSQRSRDVKPPQVIAVTKGELAELQTLHLYLGARLVVAPATYFQRTALDEENRVYFMVLDRGGVVRFVAPIAPDDEAADAAIDDLWAAAEQAERARRR
jgi:hypothetical protein